MTHSAVPTPIAMQPLALATLQCYSTELHRLGMPQAVGMHVAAKRRAVSFSTSSTLSLCYLGRIIHSSFLSVAGNTVVWEQQYGGMITNSLC